MDVSEIVEEDEEAFLKRSGQGFQYLKQADSLKYDISALNDDDPDLAKFGVLKGNSSVALLDDGPIKDSCLIEEPMKENLMIDISVERKSPLCSRFYPLDLQDWEDGIVWGNSPVASDNSVESCEISGPDETSVNSETEPDSGTQYSPLEPRNEPEEKYHAGVMHISSNLLEPFSSRSSSELSCITLSGSRCHPQLLRLQSRFEVDDHADGTTESISEKHHQSDAVRQFSKLTSQNRDMLDGSWLDQIIWDPDMPTAKTKLILDLQDEQMLFEILDNKESEHLRLHSGAMIVTRQANSSNGDFIELPGHGGQFGWRYVANDKHYSNRKTSQQLKSNSKKRTAQGIKIYHSQPALMLQTMKLRLSK